MVGEQEPGFQAESCDVKIGVSDFGTAPAWGSFFSLCCGWGLSFFFCPHHLLHIVLLYCHLLGCIFFAPW